MKGWRGRAGASEKVVQPLLDESMNSGIMCLVYGERDETEFRVCDVEGGCPKRQVPSVEAVSKRARAGNAPSCQPLHCTLRACRP